jgi:hypothetical protein
MKILTFISLLAASFYYSPAIAQDSEKKPSPIKFLMTGALEFGGDRVREIYFTNGESQSVRAGQGGSIGVGTQINLTKNEKFLLRATVGIKYVTTQADNAHIRLTRIPLVFTANYMATPKIRFGAGLAAHTNINFKADGIGPDVSFKSASGPVFEFAYSFVGISFTSMKYTDADNISYSANAIGFTFSGVFPGKR